jgi:hypothetical protein
MPKPSYKELAALLSDTSEPTSNLIFSFAQEQFDVPYYRSRGDVIRALALVGKAPVRREAVVSLLRNGFKAALLRGESGPGEHPSVEANFIGVAAAAIALGRLGSHEAEPDLRSGLTSCLNAHFELLQTAGAIGVALATVAAGRAEISDALRYCANRWKGEPFVSQLRYACWLAEGDAAGAAEWMRTEKRIGLPYAAAAIADLDAKDMAPALRALYPNLTTEAARRATSLAIARLGTQRGTPKPADRMIFGLALWHPNEPADEMPEIYATLLDAPTDPDAFAASAPSAADLTIMADTLFKAIASGDPERVRPYLSRVKELSEARDDEKRSLVHCAVENHYWEDATRKLALDVIGHSDDVNSQDEYGDTPLHVAAERDSRLVEALLEKGASINVTNLRGETALFFARRKGLRECVELLQNAQGQLAPQAPRTKQT